ncbi:hypothetical protein BDV93DRAFT_610240 [Ceratobasidium sp. AG-I]|nr:hypothetical protein BDV93DRAFT_610240 [Ceratobasidium sp. AG-I]
MSVPSLRERKVAPGPRPTSFAGIAKEADPENEDLILHRRERLIPLTKSPFLDRNLIEYGELREQRRQASHHVPGAPGPMSGSGDSASAYAGMLTADEIKDIDKSNDEERGERPPAWLDLFYDLAWAATFSNLTQNNQISGGEESVSYAVFFSMVWWMWISQVSYDIRFYSNDWFHRCMIFLQLCTFGALAAFTNHFDVTAYVGSDDRDPDQATLDDMLGVSASQQFANETASNRIPQLSFFGIALLIGISRALLCLQHARVWLYAHNKRDPAVVVKLAAMFISTCLWFGSFAMLSTSSHSEAVHISKFIMWGVATAIEVAGHIFAPQPSHLKSMGSLTARLATLVTIILGEGLNAITGTLKFAVASLGFNSRSAGLVLATAVVVYLTFYLYFEGTRPRISKNRRALWIFLHLPYMLCLILFLEGLKNLLLYAILYNSYDFVYIDFVHRFNNVTDISSDSQFFDALNSTMTPFLSQIGISWETSWQPVHDIYEQTKPGESLEKFSIELYRLMMNITVTVFESFGPENITPSGRIAVLNYLRNDSLPRADFEDEYSLPNLMSVVSVLAKPQVAGARWISALAGGTLIFLACINVTQSWPKDRYSWGSVLSRLINGCILLGLLLLNINSGDYQMDESFGHVTVWGWLDSQWALPTLAISLVVQAIIDHILLFLSVRSADRALERTYQPSLLDPLRDSKDHAYDPPIAASHFTATPGSGNFTATATSLLGHGGNNAASWQPMYNPPTLGYGGASPPSSQGYTSPHPPPQHQTSYGFHATQTPFTGSGGSGIPAGGIVTPPR